MISLLVCSFGDDRWRELAARRAVPSTYGQSADEVIVVHEPHGTLASCRNQGLDRATGDHVVYLDADDELAPGFVTAMREALERHAGPALFLPAVSYATGRRRGKPMFWPPIEPCDGNRFVIGTMVPRQLLVAVGGWREYGWSEDWSTWLRCQRAGAAVVEVPAAVYVAHRARRSKNSRLSRAERDRWHHVVRRAECPELYEATA